MSSELEKKCELLMSRIKYLGQVIDEKGRRQNLSRSIAIKDMSALTNLTTLQAFLGFANINEFKCFVKERR